MIGGYFIQSYGNFSQWIGLAACLIFPLACIEQQEPTESPSARNVFEASEESMVNPSPGGASAFGEEAEARSSRGCLIRPPSGEKFYSHEETEVPYIIQIPNSYDGSVEYPVIFAFHGHTRTHIHCRDTDCMGLDDAARGEAVLVYMKSIGRGWVADEAGFSEDSLGRNLAFFDFVLDELRADYCIDEEQIFVTGTSSGGYFSNYLGCVRGNVLQGIAPVGGAIPFTDESTCESSVAAMIIHGVDDPHVTFAAGQESRDFLRSAASCSPTESELEALHARIRTARDARRETQECMTFQDCTESITWCEHSVGGYDGSTHGWPPFAGEAIWSFFKSSPTRP
ncbi:MAG: alpha/beta hydrolase-fold protein [Polyangiaceae bacterium]|nr:alpha/beta hydrolase-fold protein [Polyangiaceae bacterium]